MVLSVGTLFGSWQRLWEGPYLVTSCLDDLINRIDKGPRLKPMGVHVN